MMEPTSVNVQIIDQTPNSLQVKLPFMDIPVSMCYKFFNERVRSGYFRLPPEVNMAQFIQKGDQ